MIDPKLAIVFRASLLMAAALLLAHVHVPLMADAFVYQLYAFRANEWGLFDDLGTLRTYGYPLFLSWLASWVGLEHLHVSVAAGVVQYLFFAGGCIALVLSLPAQQARLRLAIFAGLLLNPWLIAQVTDTLTEGLVLGLLVWTVVLTLRAFQAPTYWVFACFIAGAASVVAATVIVRPANVVAVAAWHAAVIVALTTLGRSHRHRLACAAIYLMATVIGCLLAWGPQLQYNHAVSGTFAFPLVCTLGDLQLAWGLRLWKYETIYRAGAGVAPWYYPNPLFDAATAAGPAWLWYVKNAYGGLLTLGAHVFNSFSVNYLFTYVRDLHTWYSWPLRALYWVVVVLGTYQVVGAATKRIRSGLVRQFDPQTGTVVLFLVLAVLGTIALNSITAVEVRFNVLPIAVLSVCSLYLGLGVWSGESLVPQHVRWLLAGVVVMAFWASWKMDRLGSLQLPQGAPSLTATNCALTKHAEPNRWQKMIETHRRRFNSVRLTPR